jgi:hypothetical protein
MTPGHTLYIYVDGLLGGKYNGTCGFSILSDNLAPSKNQCHHTRIMRTDGGFLDYGTRLILCVAALRVG